jgi:DNA-binding response OmpR family regulator
VVRETNAKAVRILHIGRVDAGHEKLWEQLRREGIEVHFARTQKAALALAMELQPQVVVVNLAEAQFAGVRLCQALGRRLPGARRLLIAERNSSQSVPCELRLMRPFTLRKLRDMVESLIKEAAPHLVRAGSLQLDAVVRMVRGPRGEERLTPKQCSLLTIFMRHPNQVLSRKDLMDQIWQTDFMGDTRTLDVHIRWLREKIEVDPKHPKLLLTRRGVGYLLCTTELGLPPTREDEDLEDEGLEEDRQAEGVEAA